MIKKFVKLGELNEVAYEDLILFIDNSSTVRKVVLRLVRNAKSLEFSKGNCKVALNWLVNKYALHTDLSLLKFRHVFHSSKLNSVEKDLN